MLLDLRRSSSMVSLLLVWITGFGLFLIKQHLWSYLVYRLCYSFVVQLLFGNIFENIIRHAQCLEIL